MIVVTHLLGTGHLSRALTLARAIAEAGEDVQIVAGGLPAPHLNSGDLDLVHLPGLRSDGTDFGRFLTPDGMPADATYFTARKDALLSAFTSYRPDVLITELFPFGRRSLRAEFDALLDTARARQPRVLICASVRDILAPPGKAAKIAFAEERVAAFYDLVLVHSVEAIAPLDLSWPVSDTLAPRLRYTGFVAPPPAPPHPDGLGAGEIIVSAGGGAVGSDIFAAAKAAAARDPDRTWRLLVGGVNAAAQIAHLRAGAPQNVLLEPARPDFRQILHHAAASVSMCGYNTALDILQSGCPAVCIPFDAGNEVEQSIRARALANRPGISVIGSTELTAGSLLAALRTVTAVPRPIPLQDGLDGAERTLRILQQAVS